MEAAGTIENDEIVEAAGAGMAGAVSTSGADSENNAGEVVAEAGITTEAGK